MKKEINKLRIRKVCVEKFTYKHELMDYQSNKPDCYIYKEGMYKWCAIKNWAKFIHYYDRLCKSSSCTQKLYELIPLTGKLPFYMDIEYYTNEENTEPLEALLMLFEEFTKKHHHQLLDEELDWKITKATRTKTVEDKIYWYHSFHVVLNNSNYFFATQPNIKLYIKNMLYWAQNNDDSDILQLYQTTSIQHPKNPKCFSIVDDGVYNKSFGTHQAFRCPLSYKSKDDILLPYDWHKGSDITNFELADYFVTNPNRYHSKSRSVPMPDSWSGVETKLQVPLIFNKPQATNRIPDQLHNKAIVIMSKTIPSSQFVKSEVSSSGDYLFKFLNKTHKCPIHNRIHPDMTNNNYWLTYKPCSNDWTLNCYSQKKDGKRGLNINPHVYFNSLINWDYEYADTDVVECKPFIPTEQLKVGGTFILQAPKGTGKTEAMNEFLADEIKKNKHVKILVISYRISLATKYEEDFKDHDFGFHNYQNTITSQAQVDRMIVLIDSLGKTLNSKSDYKQPHYDIIIMDELYSILEGWDSSLMAHKKLHLMTIFELLIRKTKYLYVMDAHLNNKLCINTISKLRDASKFIAHRNPNCYPYDDYHVHWYEPKKREEISASEEVDLQLWKNQIYEKLKDGKKLCIVSATKSMVTQLSDYIELLKDTKQLPFDFKHLSYTSDTCKKDKTEQLAKVEYHWKDIKCLMYSPTVSAGISYNIINDGGFDEVYVYLKTPCGGTASFNTLCQMLFRIRQLNDKQFHVFHDKNKGQAYPLDETKIERSLLLNAETIFESFGKPACEIFGKLDEKYRPRFDTDSWAYTLWLETIATKCYYSRSKNFKDGIVAELTNSPSDMTRPGRGMQLIDHSHSIEPITEETYVNIMENKVDCEEQVAKNLEDKMKCWASIHSEEGMMSEETYQWVQHRYKTNEPVSKRYEIMFKMKGADKYLNINWLSIFKSNNSDIFDQVINFQELAKFQRQKNWLNPNFDINGKVIKSFNDYYKYANKKYSGKDFKFCQALEDQWKDGYTGLIGLQEIFTILGLKDKWRTDLNGIIIPRDQIQTLLTNTALCENLLSLFKKYFFAQLGKKLGKDKSRYIRTRNFLQEWYRQNPNKHLYTAVPIEQREAFIKEHRLMQSLDVFKKASWKPKKTEKARTEFDTLCKEGKWSCPQLDALTPSQWSFTILKNYIETVCSEFIGFSFADSDKTNSGLVFSNDYNNILEYCK